MALRRALLELGSVDSIVAGVLIGDGDKLPDDKVTTIDDYDTDDYEGIAQLARDQWDFDSGASEEPLPSDWESRILSACRGGDVVCALESAASPTTSPRTPTTTQRTGGSSWRTRSQPPADQNRPGQMARPSPVR